MEWKIRNSGSAVGGILKTKISYTKPSITELEVKYATDAAQNGWGEKCYDYINRFEAKFAEHLGVKHAIATSSCTGALHMGIYALGLKPGDEVILADTNWVATVSPVVHLGLKPVFVDIDPESWCLDPLCVERAITPKTKLIIATHIYGNLADMDKLFAIGEKHGITVIEDAAEAIGSVYKGKRVGSLGKFGTFSFHGTKTITTGEGGMFVTNDSSLYERVLTLSNHGRSRQQKKQFWPDEIGFKYKMSNIQAAIGLGQIERIDELINRKREIFHYYQNTLKKFDFITMNPEPRGCTNGYWMPTIVFSKESGVTQDLLMQKFKAENVDARVFFHPLSGLDMFASRMENIHAWSVPSRAINLPSYHEISESDLNRVLTIVSNNM